MPTPRYYPGAGVVNGTLYVVGGGSGYGAFYATLEAYNPATDSWTPKAPMPTPNSGPAIAVVNGLLYAIGGGNGTTAVATVEAYDPATDTWTSKAPMPTARGGLSAAVVNGIIYAVGGGDASGTLSTVEAYDPGSNTWTPQASLPAGLYLGQNSAYSVNGVLYAICAQLSVDSGVRVVAAFTPAAANPAEMIESLALITAGLNLSNGIANSLDAKLDCALRVLEDHDADNDLAACNSLTAFINAVTAQGGKNITDSEAAMLIARASAIKTALGCH